MKTCIALLRGINVGGRNTLPMKELVDILEHMGMQNVRTYARSGNAVFQSGENNPATLSRKLAAGIKHRRGFQPHVLILGLDALERAIQQNPFPEAESEPRTLHLGFLAFIPKEPDLDRLDSLRRQTERFRLSDAVFYLHALDGIGRSKLAANAEKLLGVPMTDRNWRAVCKIWELAGN
jgi:uncharacterized protein (DUF1697 family)